MSRVVALALALFPYYACLGYKLAYVEHHATSACGSGSCGTATKRQNVQAYEYYIQAAASGNASMIVFPEYGITGESSYPAQSWYQGGYTESFPSKLGANPCDDGWQYAPSVVALSCAARKNGVAVVFNLAEWDETAYKMYNTDVVIDADGSLLATYRKLNLWGESNYMSVPGGCPKVRFTTKFGATFGLFTCADLIYEYPANKLVEEGVENFVMPAAWSDEMAQMQVMGFAQGWSLEHGVNFILCNHRDTGESGSGVWLKGQPQSYSFFPAAADGALKIADMQPAPLEGRTVQQPTPNGSNFTTSSAALHLENAGWHFASLQEGASVCSSSVCCTATGIQGSPEGYALAALNGKDSDDGVTWRAQICAVLPCAGGTGQRCLNYQRPQGSLTAVHVEAKGMAASHVVPEVITETPQQEEILLAPGSEGNGFNCSTPGAGTYLLAAETRNTITSAVVYGRVYAQDTLPYDCPSQSAH